MSIRPTFRGPARRSPPPAWEQPKDLLLHHVLEGMQHEAPYHHANLQGVRLTAQGDPPARPCVRLPRGSALGVGQRRAGIERYVIAAIAPGESPPSPSLRVSRWLWLAAIRPGWSGHAQAGRFDPEERWEHAFGKEYDETGLEKLTRHTAAYRGWLHFLSRTLLGR